jgi:hypothetical protein
MPGKTNAVVPYAKTGGRDAEGRVVYVRAGAEYVRRRVAGGLVFRKLKK